MKTMTIDDALSFGPCWKDARERMENITEKYNQQNWTALDVLKLPEQLVSDEDKLWLVLREELVDAPILHEFACRCAERALARLDTPDPRSLAAIAAKRAWLKGEITDEQLDQVQEAAHAAYFATEMGAYYASDRKAYCAAYYAADHADRWAARAAYFATKMGAYYAANRTAYCAAYYAADHADRWAARAAYADANDANDADGERAWQVEILIKMIEEDESHVQTAEA